MSCIEPVIIGEHRYAPEGTSEIYTFNFNGAKDLSLGQLIMAVCINRSAALERASVSQSNKLASTTNLLNAASKAIQVLFSTENVTLDSLTRVDLTSTGYISKTGMTNPSLLDFFTEDLGANLSYTAYNISPYRGKTSAYDIDSICYAIDRKVANMDSDAKNLAIQIKNHLSQYRTGEKALQLLSMGLSGITLSFYGLWEIMIPLKHIAEYEYSNVEADYVSLYDLIYHELGLTSYKYTGDGVDFNKKMEIFNQVKVKMEELTRLSKDQAIDLQSLVNWRDVTYNMSSTITGALMNEVLDMAGKC